MSTGYLTDAAEMPQASVDFDWDAVEEEGDKNPNEELLQNLIKEKADEMTRLALIKFIAILIDSNNYALKLDIAIAALGFPFRQGKSFTSLGESHNISRQAFSKRVRRFQDDFSLPPTRAQKSVASREKYRQAQLKRYEQAHN